MQLEDLTEEMLPESVRDKMLELAPMNTGQLFQVVLELGRNFCLKIIEFRGLPYSDRLEKARDGVANTVDLEEECAIYFAALWFMPDEFLDRMIQIISQLDEASAQLTET